MNNSWSAVLEEDPETGDIILPFPPDFMTENDWRIDDTLKFSIVDEMCIITNLSRQERQTDKVAES